MCAVAQQGVYHLNWSEKEQQVVIEPSDHSKFVMTMEEVIEACRIYSKEQRLCFQVQFTDLLNHLGAWAYAHREKIAKTFLTLRESRLLFLVVTQGKAYDDEFESELTTLDLEVAHSDGFSGISLSVQSLPNCGPHAYASFCKPGATIQYGGMSAK